MQYSTNEKVITPNGKKMKMSNELLFEFNKVEIIMVAAQTKYKVTGNAKCVLVNASKNLFLNKEALPLFFISYERTTIQRNL